MSVMTWRMLSPFEMTQGPLNRCYGPKNKSIQMRKEFGTDVPNLSLTPLEYVLTIGRSRACSFPIF